MGRKIDWQSVAVIAGIAAVVVYASNRRVPVFGNGVRRAIG